VQFSRTQFGQPFLAFYLLCAGLALPAFAQEEVRVTELSPTLLVLSTSTGNVLTSVGPDGALLLGTPSVSSTAQVANILEKRTKSAVRHVVIFPQGVDQTQGDAGWGKRGAFVAMHENALNRLGGHAMGANRPLPERLLKIGVDRPRVSFSEVLTYDLNGEAIHIIHQPPGYSNADAIVHLHEAKLVYLGEVYPGDGYPGIDPAQGGQLDGILRTLESWSDADFRIVPARGDVVAGPTLKAFHDMIVVVRDRVRQLIDLGKTEAEIVAAHPSEEFNAKWGHGRVSPGEFVRELYASFQPSKKD
jgi:cyclase